MSSQYTTEPPATASVILHTTAGPIPLSLFAAQTPLTCRNFLQHCLDGIYDNVLFHRIAADFVIQTGDPTGTGEGGQNVYEDKEFERYDKTWAKLLGREEREKIEFKDEVHSRLKFNRRGLVGMAKMGDGYGSQFFVTLGDCRGELDGRCTMFGRVEGEGIYNMVKIAEGEVVGERPVFPERITRVEVTQMPNGEAWEGMRKRRRVEERVVEEVVAKRKVVKKQKKGLLSFAGEEGEDGEDVLVKPKKAKFNTALIDAGPMKELEAEPHSNGHATKEDRPPPAKRRKPSVSPPRRDQLLASMTAQSPPPRQQAQAQAQARKPRKPSFHDPTTQLPLRNEEIPSRSETPDSPVPSTGPSKSTLEAEIAALKASMRRDVAPVATKNKKLSALEAMIPATSTRGRKRPRPGETSQGDDKGALALLNAFKARLDEAKGGDGEGDVDMQDADANAEASTVAKESKRLNGLQIDPTTTTASTNADDGEEDEAAICDLHFIANCQSCSKWNEDLKEEADDNDDGAWMSHKLAFGKDQLGKDLNFKKRNEALEELVVIDPREKAGQILAAEREKMRLAKEARQRR